MTRHIKVGPEERNGMNGGPNNRFHSRPVYFGAFRTTFG